MCTITFNYLTLRCHDTCCTGLDKATRSAFIKTQYFRQPHSVALNIKKLDITGNVSNNGPSSKHTFTFMYDDEGPLPEKPPIIFIHGFLLRPLTVRVTIVLSCCLRLSTSTSGITAKYYWRAFMALSHLLSRNVDDQTILHRFRLYKGKRREAISTMC